jgi:hypothetical protein
MRPFSVSQEAKEIRVKPDPAVGRERDWRRDLNFHARNEQCDPRSSVCEIDRIGGMNADEVSRIIHDRAELGEPRERNVKTNDRAIGKIH